MTRMTKQASFVLAASLLLVGAGQAWAADAPDAADRVVASLNLEPQWDEGFSAVLPLVSDNIISTFERQNFGNVQELLANGRGGRDRLQRILSEEIARAFRLQFPQLRKEVAELYRARFSPAELAEVEAFIATDVGRKWFAGQLEIGRAMTKLGEKAGMRAGGEAMTTALPRAEAEMLGPDGNAPARKK